MKKIIAKIDFIVNGKSFVKGDEINDCFNIEQIKKLNEKGFIEPLDYKDLILIERELKNNKKKEEL